MQFEAEWRAVPPELACRSTGIYSIALLFGFGNLFDSIVSVMAYIHLLKKEGIRI